MSHTPTCHMDIIGCLPNMFQALYHSKLYQRAQHEQRLNLRYWQLHDFADQPHGHIDDRPFGGGPGMLIRPEPVDQCLQTVFQQSDVKPHLVSLSPQGTPLTHNLAKRLAKQQHIVLLCGRYEGIDERINLIWQPEEISVGDYVLTGGELPAMVLIDAMIRWIPGILGNMASSTEDSFEHGLLDAPHYTRPVDFKGHKVPEVLRSGHAKHIALWRHQMSLLATRQKRPDLLDQRTLSKVEQALLLKSMQA